MKKALSIIVVCSLLSVQSIFSFSISKKQPKKFVAQYFASVVLSGCIGAVTGELVRCLEKELDVENSPAALFFYLLTWTLESLLRNEFVAVLQKDLDAYSISYRKYLMFKTAQIASWMMYLREHIQKKMNNQPKWLFVNVDSNFFNFK